MKRIVINIHDIQEMNWPVVYQFIEDCNQHHLIDNNTFDKMTASADIAVDSSNYKHDVISTQSLEKFLPNDIANEEKLLFVFITKPADESTTPLDYIPLFLLQRKYPGILSIGVDLINLPDGRKQETLIFRFSAFCLFIKDLEYQGGYHSFYFINEIVSSSGNRLQFYRNRISSFRYKSAFSNISWEDIVKQSSTKFNPLMHIDKHLFLCMFQNEGYKDKSLKEIDFLESSSNKIMKRLKNVTELSTKKYSSLFEKWFVLAFFNSLPPTTVDNKTVQYLSPILHSYYIGIYELVQNIVFHTKEQEGWIYVYFCKQESLSSNSLVSLKKYNVELSPMYLRVGVYDFAKFGIIDTYNSKNNENIDNLADIVDPHIIGSKNIQENEYLLLKYVAHLGIKTLVSSIIQHHGLFQIETSHKGKKIFIENQGCILSKQQFINNAEGTYYNIVMPIESPKVKPCPYQIESPDSAFFSMLGNVKKIRSISIRELANYYYLGSITDRERQDKVLFELIDEISNVIANDLEQDYLPNYYALDMSDVEMLTANMIFRILAAMQLGNRQNNHITAIILYNLGDDTIDSMCNIVKIIGNNKNGMNQPIWSREHAIVLMNKSFRIQILCGETKQEVSGLNSWFERKYNGFTNIFSEWNNTKKGDHTFIDKRFLLPYECMIYHNKKPLFLERVSSFLDKNINTNGDFGFLVDGVLTKIGSKMYVEKFYDADTLFLNSFFSSRFAFLIAVDIINKLGSRLFQTKNIVLIGYKTFSDLTIRMIQSYINAYVIEGNDAKGKIIIQDTIIVEERVDGGLYFRPKIEECNWPFKDSTFILLVPVASTLSTHNKIVTYFMKETRLEAIPSFYNYCAILVRDGESLSVSSFEEEWQWKELDNDLVETRLPCANYVNYLISKSAKWHKLIDDKTYPPSYSGERYLNRTGDPSLNLWNMFGYPMVSLPSKKMIRKEVMFFTKEQNKLDDSKILQEYYEITKKRINEFRDHIVVGHTINGHNHHRYYYDTEDYIRSNKHVELTKWMDFLRTKHILWRDQSKIPVIIVPEYNKESTFINLVNDKLFDNNALIICINVSDSIDNVKSNYSFLSQSELFSFFFLDHAILTAETFEKTSACLSAILNKPDFKFNGILTILNRLSEMTHKVIFGNLEGGAIISFVHLFIPPSKERGEECTLCGLRKHYENLLNFSVVEACREVIKSNIQKFNVPMSTKGVNEREYTRMMVRHELFFMISCIQNNYPIDFLINSKNGKEYQKIIEDNNDYSMTNRVDTALKLYYQNLSDNIDLKISFFKAITFPPLSQYVYIRRFAHYMAVNELQKTLSKTQPKYEDFCLLKTLLKHLSWLSSNTIIRKEVIILSWKLCLSVTKEILTEICQIRKDISLWVNPASQEPTDVFFLSLKTRESILKDNLKETEKFGAYYQFCIKNANYMDEAKSFFLGELLRTGDETNIHTPFESSKTILYNTLFRMIKYKDIPKDIFINTKKVIIRNPFRIFLSNAYYDNTTIFRKALDNFNNDIQKDCTLSQFFPDPEKECSFDCFNEFNKNVTSISEKLLDIVNTNYYYYWFRLLLVKDTLNPGRHMDASQDGVPIIKKLVYVLYAQNIINKIIKLRGRSFENDVSDLLQIASAIMDSVHSFITIKFEGKLYNLADHNINIEFENQGNNLYCGQFLSMNEDDILYPFIINDRSISTNDNQNNNDLNRLCCQLLGQETIEHHKYVGAVTYLYADNDERFRIKKIECSRILLLLKPEIEKYVDHCYRERLFTLWFKRMNIINQIRRINLSSNHSLRLDGWGFENLDIDNYKKFATDFYMLSNVVISHLFSILIVDHEINIKSETKDTGEIFSNKFIILLEELNIKYWGRKLIISNIKVDNKRPLSGNVLIIQSFVIQCIDNAFKKLIKKNDSNRFIIKLIIGSCSIEIWNNFPNIGINEILEEQNSFNEKYNYHTMKENLRNDRMSDYGMTLTSLKMYCESTNLSCNYNFDLNGEPSFYVKLTSK